MPRAKKPVVGERSANAEILRVGVVRLTDDLVTAQAFTAFVAAVARVVDSDTACKIAAECDIERTYVLELVNQ